MPTPLIIRRTEFLKKWGFREMPPFSDVPPKDDIRILSRLFTGREKEIDRAILTLLDGNNILVRGVWGVGKTTFILQSLHEFAAQAKLLKEKTLPIYIDNFKGGLLKDFYRLVLFSLSTALEDIDKDAESIAKVVKGVNITHSKSVSSKGSAEINFLTAAKISAEIGVENGQENQLSIENTEYWVEELINRAKKKYDHIIIAVDDLDKADPAVGEVVKIREMFDGALPLLRSNKCSFILAGRTLTVAQDIYGRVLGIFREQIQLPKLNDSELHEIAVKTMNLVRYKSSDDTYPIEIDAMNELISNSGGNPRQFNRNCSDILNTAVMLGKDILDKNSFRECFAEVQRNIGDNIDEHVKHLLYVAQKYGGVSQSNRQAIKELNKDDFIEIIPMLEELVHKDLMYRDDDENGPRYLVSARAEQAAKVK
jgi:Cdc6-like AAA superfamily ATPase